MPSCAVGWNGSWRPIPRRRISWPGLPSSVLGATHSTVSPTRPDYDPTQTGLIAVDGPAPQPGRQEDIPGQGSPPGPTPTTSSDVTTDLPRIAECSIITEVTPTERRDNGRSPAPNDVDLGTPVDPQATTDMKAQPIADSGVTGDFVAESPGDFGATGDFTPRTSTGSVIPERIDANTDQIPGDAGDVDPNRTASLSATDPDRTASVIRPPGRSPVVSPARSRTDTPEVPGYEILGTLGRGGMGVVYKARQTGLNRLVALKMIIGGSLAGEKQLARFRIEAEAVAQLRHPNIVQIYDIGEVEGMPFVSLEFLDGGDLAGRLDSTPQPGMAAAELMATLARAIHAAHQARIVHRDLKPANVLLAGDGTPKITDFGLAKRLESEDHQTQSGDIMGTPSYMAPEQALGRTKDVGPAADIYALGAILYEVLTGRPPLKGETVMETVRLVIHEDPVPPSRLVPRLARDLETICLKCLNKDPQRRYATAEELADDLDRYREGRPIKARPTTVWVRGYKWAKRRPVAALSVAAGVLLLIGLTGGVIGYQRYKLNQESQRNAWVDQHNKLGMERLDQADKASTPVELQKAQIDLARFLEVAGAEPRLQPISLRIQAKQKSVDDRLKAFSSREAAEQRNRVDRERYQKFLDLSQDAQLSAAGFGVMNEKDRFEKLQASAHAALTHLRPGSGGGRRGLDPGGAVAGRADGHREGQGGRRLLQPALDLIAGGGAGRRTADPRPGRPASPEDDRRVPPPPRRVPRAHGRPRGPGPRESRSQPDRSRDGAGLLSQRSRAGPPPPVRRRRSSAQLGPASRSREHVGPPPARGLLPQHATESVEPGQDQFDHVHPEPSRPGGPVSDACPRRRGGGQPGPREDRPVAPR